MAYSYATEADWQAAHEGEPVPTNLDRYLRHASAIMLAATKGAVYAVGHDGFPIFTLHRHAFRDAVLAQVDAWHALNIDPTKGAAGLGTVSKRVSFGSASYGGESRKGQDEDRARTLSEPVPLAMEELRAAGLLNKTVIAR